MLYKYIVRQQDLKGYEKIIAIRNSVDEANSLVDYLHKVDAKNTYYYHIATTSG